MRTPVDPARIDINFSPANAFATLERDKNVHVPAHLQSLLATFLWGKGFRADGDRAWVRDAEVSEDGVAVRILRRGDTLLYDRNEDDRPNSVLAVTRGVGKANVFRVGRAYDATLQDAAVSGVKVLQAPIEIPLTPLGGAHAIIVAPWECRGGPTQGRYRGAFQPDCDLVALTTDTPFGPLTFRGRVMDNPIAIKNIAQGWSNPDGSIYLRFNPEVPYLPRTAKNRGLPTRSGNDPDATWWKEHMEDFMARNAHNMSAAKLMIFPRAGAAR